MKSEATEYKRSIDTHTRAVQEEPEWALDITGEKTHPRRVEFNKRKERLIQGELSESHPLYQALDTMLSRIVDARGIAKPELVVHPFPKEQNAYVDQEGVIHINLELAVNAESIDGIAGIIAHELRHHIQDDVGTRIEHATRIEAAKDKAFDLVEKEGVLDFSEIAEAKNKAMSSVRAQEHRADLQGAVIDLDAAGYNPLGFKLEMLRIEQQQRRKKITASTTHGRSIDRALSVGLLAHYHDLSNLSHDVEEITDEQRREWKKGKPGREAELRFMFDVATATKPFLVDKMSRIIESDLSDEEVQLYFAQFVDHWKKGPSDGFVPRLREKTTAWLTTVCDSFSDRTDAMLKERFEGGDYRFARGLHYHLNVGLPIGRRKKEEGVPYYGRGEEAALRAYAGISSREKVVTVIRLIREVSEVPGEYAIGDPYDVVDLCLAGILKHDVYAFETDESGVAAFVEDMQLLTDTLATVHYEKGISYNYVVTQDHLMDSVKKRVALRLKKKEEVSTAVRQAIQLGLEGAYVPVAPPEIPKPEQRRNRIKDVLENDGRQDKKELKGALREIQRICDDIVTPVVERLRQQKNILAIAEQGYEQILLAFSKIIPELSPKEVEEAILIMHRAYVDIDSALDFEISDVSHFMKGEEKQKVAERKAEIEKMDNPPKTSAEINRLMAHSTLLQAHKRKEFREGVIAIIESHPAFADRSQVVRNTMTMDIKAFNAQHPYIDVRRGQDQEVEEGTEQVEYETDTQFINTLHEDIFTQWKTASIEDIVWLCNVYKGKDGRRIEPSFPEDVERETDVYSFVSNIAVHVLVERLSSTVVEDIALTIDDWQTRGIPVIKMLARGRGLAGKLVRHVVEGLQRGEIDESSDTYDRLLSLLEVCNSDVHMRSGLRELRLRARLAKATTFEERVDIAFDTQDGVGHTEFIDELIEEEMETKETVDYMRKKIRSSLDDFVDSGSEEAAKVIAFDWTQIGARDALPTLDLLLSTAESDRRMKDEVFHRVYGESQYSMDRRAAGGDKEILARLVYEAIQQIDRGLDALYALSPMARQALNKRLLLDSGVIERGTDRVKMAHLLVDHAIAKTKEGGISSTIDAVAQALEHIKDWELVYYVLAPEVAKYIGVVPFEQVEWDDIYAVEERVGGQLSVAALREVGREFIREGADKPWMYKQALLADAEDVQREYLMEKNVFEQAHAKKDMTPAEFLVEAVPRMGALAVRFLQLLPQFVHIPEEEQRIFDKMYDGLRGQSKVAAVSVVEREWKNATGDDMWNHVDAFGSRLGGGSLMTVYDLEQPGEAPQVVRTRNPNIQYHLDATKAFVHEVFDGLQKNNFIDRNQHKRLGMALDMVEEWIRLELDYTGFLERDAQFKADNDGFTVDGGEFSMYVPQSKGPESNYFQVEEKIEGHNLTEWDVLTEQYGADGMKEIIATIAQSIRSQIPRGLIHGDIHPGNYRVTGDKRIAILDRTFYIQLDGLEQQLLEGIFTGEIDQMAVMSFIQSRADRVKPEDGPKAMVHLGELAQGIESGDFVQVNNGILSLRDMGVDIPLSTTLLMRNYHSLERLAQRAGFASAKEALTYTHK